MAGAQFVKKKPDVVSALRPAFFIQYLESCISRLNVIPCHDLTLSVGEPDNAAAKLRSEQTVTPLHEQSPATYFLRLNNLETFVELVGARPLHLLSQTVLPLKSPTGAFIAALRFANAVPPQTLLIIRALRHEWNGVSCLHNFTEELSNRQEVQ